MSLLGIEIAELREMNSKLMSGKITTKECNTRLKVYKATLERQRMILDCHKLATLKGITLGKIESTGIISSGETVSMSISERDGEQINCPDLCITLTRSQCLDFSGDAKNSKSCRSCNNFETTRNLLMPS